jgi:hypothetical protein
MVSLVDNVFGSLELDYCWYKNEAIHIFGMDYFTPIRVAADQQDEITENQREAYKEYCKEKKMIIEKVENAVYTYYLDNVTAMRSNSLENKRDLCVPIQPSMIEFSRLISLDYIRFLYSKNTSVRKIGFVFDAKFDPELGVGVLVVNGQISEVSVQDIVI